MAAEQPLVRTIFQYRDAPSDPFVCESDDSGMCLQDRDGTRFYLSAEAIHLILEKKASKDGS